LNSNHVFFKLSIEIIEAYKQNKRD